MALPFLVLVSLGPRLVPWNRTVTLRRCQQAGLLRAAQALEPGVPSSDPSFITCSFCL